MFSGAEVSLIYLVVDSYLTENVSVSQDSDQATDSFKGIHRGQREELAGDNKIVNPSSEQEEPEHSGKPRQTESDSTHRKTPLLLSYKQWGNLPSEVS